jgi:hypothetical protein
MKMQAHYKVRVCNVATRYLIDTAHTWHCTTRVTGALFVVRHAGSWCNVRGTPRAKIPALRKLEFSRPLTAKRKGQAAQQPELATKAGAPKALATSLGALDHGLQKHALRAGDIVAVRNFTEAAFPPCEDAELSKHKINCRITNVQQVHQGLEDSTLGPRPVVARIVLSTGCRDTKQELLAAAASRDTIRAVEKALAGAKGSWTRGLLKFLKSGGQRQGALARAACARVKAARRRPARK